MPASGAAFLTRQNALARLKDPARRAKAERPRVTEVLRMAGLSPDYSGISAEVLKAAADRGTQVHAMIAEAHRRDIPPERFAPAGGKAKIPAEVAPYWRAVLKFVADTQHVPLYSEVLVEHAQWRYVGHLDRIGLITVPHRRGPSVCRCLLDWKCVATLDVVGVAFQLAAYRLAWNSMHPTEFIDPGDCGAVQLKRDATYRLVMIPAPQLLEAEQVWLAALTLYHARMRMERTAWPKVR